MPTTQTLEAGTVTLGRLFLAGIFLHEGLGKLASYSRAGAYMQAFGLPPALLPLAIAVELGCGLMIAAGLFTRVAAFLLAGFCLVTAVVFHQKLGDVGQLLHFEKNVAIAGGFLVLLAGGAGPWSLDAKLRGRRGTV